MELQQLLKDLKVTGIRIKDIAERTGVSVNTLYSISSGKKISKEKEQYLITILEELYKENIQNITIWRASENSRSN